MVTLFNPIDDVLLFVMIFAFTEHYIDFSSDMFILLSVEAAVLSMFILSSNSMSPKWLHLDKWL